MTHAFFKALLFLGAGSVIHAMSGEQDMRFMGGLKSKIPVTYQKLDRYFSELLIVLDQVIDSLDVCLQTRHLILDDCELRTLFVF